jgi:intracellular multiplication protein IcmB
MVGTSIVIFVVLGVILAFAWMSRSKLERFLYYISGFQLRGDIQAHVALGTPVAPDVMRTNDGDLVTYLRIRGARRLIGPADFDAMADKVSDQLQIKLQDGTGLQHKVTVGYLSDPVGTTNLITDLLRGATTTARRMGASANSKLWFDVRAQFLSKLCNDETIILAVYTLKTGLNPQEAERYAEWTRKAQADLTKDLASAVPGTDIKSGSAADPLFNQVITPIYPVLLSRHDAMVEDLVASIQSEAAGIGIMVDKMKISDAMYCLRRFVDGSGVPVNWRPDMFGDRAPTGSTLRRTGDIGNMMPASLARQFFSEPMKEDFSNFEVVEREGIWYGSLKLDVAPHEDPAPGFSHLASRLGKRFPYATSLEISPQGMKQKQMDQLFAGFFGGFGSHNRALRDGWAELKKMSEAGKYVAAARMVCTTWAADRDTLQGQISLLKMALQSWGGTTVSNESGSPLHMLLATAPSLSRYNPAPYIPGPLSTFARMMPIYEAASPWNQGQLLLRTIRGKPYPVAFGSPIQAFWGTLVFAPPGRGKSFLMNCLNAGLLFSPGLSDLPYIVIIDKGMSSANVIEMARGILPPSRRHQAISIRLRNTAEYAINMFDTQLGLDVPTERERDSQVNMVTSLCPGLGPEGTRFVGQVIDAAYKNLGRASLSAKRWQRALDPDITEKLLKMGMDLSDDAAPRIYDVVDALFDAGDVHAAVQAQRYAVPILDDLIAAAHTDSIQDLYRNTPSATSEMITAVFQRSITTASREYALLSTYTRFDVGDARVISIDLEEVLASASSEESRRRAETMILFARQLGAKNFFLKWDEVAKQVPERYQRYQSARIQVMWETLKFLEYDEFHNAHGMENVLRMVKQDFREGRKYNVVPLLSSQLFSDFDKDLVQTANNFFVLGVGSAEAAKEIQTTFELSDAERLSILNDCLGPGPKGAPVFAMFKTDKGTVSQLLYNSASSMEQWAFNSSALDVAVRKVAQRELGDDYWLMLKGLSDVFPEGTARFEIDRVRQDMTGDEEADEDGIAATVARRAAAKILANINQKAAQGEGVI